MSRKKGLFVVAVDRERGIVTVGSHGPRCGCCGEVHERATRHFMTSCPERFWVGEYLTTPLDLLDDAGDVVHFRVGVTG